MGNETRFTERSCVFLSQLCHRLSLRYSLGDARCSSPGKGIFLQMMLRLFFLSVFTKWHLLVEPATRYWKYLNTPPFLPSKIACFDGFDKQNKFQCQSQFSCSIIDRTYQPSPTTSWKWGRTGRKKAAQVKICFLLLCCSLLKIVASWTCQLFLSLVCRSFCRKFCSQVFVDMGAIIFEIICLELAGALAWHA